MTADGAISLLDADPALADGIGSDDLARARRVLAVPRAAVPRGPCAPAELCDGPGHASVLLVVEGVLARDVTVHERTTTQLLGPGDLLCREMNEADLLGSQARFEVLQAVTLAVLDGRFPAGARAGPARSTRVHERFGLQFDRLSRQLAVLALPRVEDRVIAMLWLLAERWGVVRSDGVFLPVPLTHERLGRLTAARRPTVTLAVRDLSEAGDLSRLDDGWLLHRELGSRGLPSAR